MQKWFTDQKFDSLKIASINTLRTNVQWAKANSVQGDGTLSYNIVPITLDTVPKFDNANTTLTKYLVLTKANETVTNSAIIELLGNKKTLTSDFDKLIINYYKTSQEDFTGIITVKNIYSSFKESKQYVAGTVALHRVIQARGITNGKTILSGGKKTLACIDWYEVTYRGGYIIEAQYLYTECDNGGDGCEFTSIIDHKAVQSIRTLCGGFGGSDGSGESEIITQDTIIDQSIKNNPKLNCIDGKLTDNKVFNNLISNFLKGSTYNLTIKAAPLNSNDYGITSYDPNLFNGNVTITLNSNNVDLASAIDLATTFIHEAYHAFIAQNLIQRSLAGTYVFNQPYADTFDQYVTAQVDSVRSARMALNQPYDPQMVSHDIIAANIDIIANGVKQYAEEAWPALKTDPSITFDHYRATAWASKGLATSTSYAKVFDTADKVNDLAAKRNLLTQSTTHDCN